MLVEKLVMHRNKVTYLSVCVCVRERERERDYICIFGAGES